MTLVSWNSKVFHWLLYKIVRSWQLQVIDKLIETNTADSALLYKTCHVVHDVLQTYRTWLGKIYEIVQVRSKFQAKNFTTLGDGTWRKWLEKSYNQGLNMDQRTSQIQNDGTLQT